MSDKTAIGWTDATWNPTTGCTQIPGPHNSPSGCDLCYAKKLIDSRMSVNPKSVRFGHPFETVMMHPERLDQPLRWRDPRRIFVNSLSDLFHHDVPVEFVAKVWGVMMQAQRHTFQVLTKRPEAMAKIVPFIYDAFLDMEMMSPYYPPHDSGSYTTPAANIWLGVSISSNQDAWRADVLRRTPARIRFLSLEPLLGSVDQVSFQNIDWVIVGGESGRGARPMDIDWARDVIARCIVAGIPVFLKQLGGHPNKRAGDEALLDGKTWERFPA